MTDFSSTVNENGIRVAVDEHSQGFFDRFRRRQKVDFHALTENDRALALAVATLRGLDPDGKHHHVNADGLFLDHWLLSRVDDYSSAVLKLPERLSGVEFHAETVGTVGSARFSLEWWWVRDGRQVRLNRTGAVLAVGNNRMRLPAPIYDAIEIADKFDSRSPLTTHWAALARYRSALLGAEQDWVRPEPFLSHISIVSCDRVGIGFDPEDPSVFGPVPFVSCLLDDDTPGVADSALPSDELKAFQTSVVKRGAQPAFWLGANRYIILDPATVPVVDVIARYARSSTEERRYFIENAETIIAAAIEDALRKSGQLNELMGPEQEAETIESALQAVWTATREWTDRVIAIRNWKKPLIEMIEGSGTNWLPPDVEATLGEILGMIPEENLAGTLGMIDSAIRAEEPTIELAQGTVPANALVREAIRRRLEHFLNRAESKAPDDTVTAVLPITYSNFWELEYRERMRPRPEVNSTELPETVSKPLKAHQVEAFSWQVDAWSAGLPGILNADEQGLGKTLETLSFLCWIAQRVEAGDIPNNPILVVAPTSLLKNWEAEIKSHLRTDAFDAPIPLYSSTLSNWRKRDYQGRDLQDGVARLDLSELYRGTRPKVVITTYQTVANYAVSFAENQFSVAVFDEIQNLKNPATLRSSAAKAVRADFRIGLTGTPVENATRDIWAIVDQLFPGALGSLVNFRRTFDSPRAGNMRELHQAIFLPQSGHPRLGLRRTKDTAALGLPPKTRVLHPRLMSDVQALRYDEARRPGQALFSLLHHIRRTSLHPGLVQGEDPNSFTLSSARVAAALDILRLIAARGERVLVFIENRDVQGWFAELVKHEFNLKRVDVINGDTPVSARKEINDRFQRHLETDEGFDLLILGPRAAGTGLTLTAANHVIHLTRWWNPAVEEQCNDRTHRIGQKKPVTIHIPLAIHPRLQRGSFDCLLQSLMRRKRSLADSVLWPPESDENEARQLYDAIVAADVDNSETNQGATLDLADRQDLIAEELGQNTIRVAPRLGGASILVSSEPSALSEVLAISDDVEAIILASSHERVSAIGLPLSVLGQTTLWPEFVLPE